MPSRGRRIARPGDVRAYRKLFVIATEGEVTEPEYFRLLGSRKVSVHWIRHRNASAPFQALGRIRKYIRHPGIRATDEAWLVVDKDRWSDEQLDPLHAWACQQDNYGLALSNPKFEYWLLLHFEGGAGISTSKQCSDRLQKCLPHYSKSIKPQDFPDERIRKAVARARQRDHPPCADWPRTVGTTVYRLVEKMLQAEDSHS